MEFKLHLSLKCDSYFHNFSKSMLIFFFSKSMLIFLSGGGYGGGYGSGYGGGYGSGYGGSFGGYSSSMNNPTSFKNPYSLSRATPTSSRLVDLLQVVDLLQQVVDLLLQHETCVTQKYWIVDCTLQD